MLAQRIHTLRITTPLIMAGKLASCQQYLAANFHKHYITKPEGKLRVDFKPDTVDDKQTRITVTFNFVYPIHYPYGLQYGVISQIEALMRIDKPQQAITHSDLKRILQPVLKHAGKVCDQLATGLTGVPINCKFPIKNLRFVQC